MGDFEMDAAEWKTLSRLLDEALDLPIADREAWLDRLSPGYEALKPKLSALLAHAGRTGEGRLGTLPKIVTEGLEATEGEPSDATGTPGKRVGPYRLVRLLGEGGMGTVWLAERADGILQRSVAMKLPRGLWSRPELAQRLAREREILASLEHPHIARLYDAGLTVEGQPYLALEYVEGKPIDEYVREKDVDTRARLRLFLQVAHAVAHAHARLVVHRDLKPSNVLVTGDGEVRLLDFGIAKLLEDGQAVETEITRLSGRALTLAYASPEQVSGEPIGVASDVYSLGVLLYELLTSSRPYEPARETRGALEDAILHADPRRPSDAASAPAVRRALRGDLDTILLKALKKKPEDRYATVHGFAEDATRFLEGRPVIARADTATYRMRKFVGRHRLAVAAACLVSVAIVVGAGIAVWQSRVALAEKERAEEVKEFIVSIFRDANPYAEGATSLSAVGLLKQAESNLDERFDARADLRAELLGLIGSGLIGLEDYRSAEEMLRGAVAESSEALGPNAPLTLGLRLLLNDAHRYLGQTEEMSAELAALMPELRRDPSGLGDELVHALQNQAHLAIDEGRYDEAVAAASEAFELSLARHGDENAAAVESSLLIAVSQQYGASPEEALESAEQAFRLTMNNLKDDEDHPRAIDARAIYGRALGNAGRLDEAVTQLERVVTGAAKLFGPQSPMIGFYSADLAKYYADLGELERSIETAETSVTILSEVAAPESFTYAAAQYRRGASLLAARRAASALSDLTDACEKLDAALGPTHPRAALAHALRALALAYVGERENALLEIRVAIDRKEDEPEIRYAMGVIHRLSGNATEALRWQEALLASVADGPGAERRRMLVLAEIGLARLDLRQYDRARPALERALAMSRRLQRRTTPEASDALVGLGRAQLAEGDGTGAIASLEAADAFWRGFDPESRWAGEAALWLGRAYDGADRTVEAEAALSRARRILEPSSDSSRD